MRNQFHPKKNNDIVYATGNHVYHKSAGGIVLFMNNKSLFIALLRWKEKNGWTFPKGHVKTKETIKQAAQREVQEELGVINCPPPIKKLGVEHIIFKLPRDNRIHYKQTHIYLFLLDKKYQLIPNKAEHFISAKWLSLDKIEGMIKPSPFVKHRYLKIKNRAIQNDINKHLLSEVKKIVKNK